VCERMCTFLNVPYDDAMMQHERQKHSVHVNAWGHPAAEATRKSLTTEVVGRHRRDLSDAQIREFEAAAGLTLAEPN